MKRTIKRLLLPAIWFAVIIILTSIPSPQVPVHVKHLDKIAHLLLYVPLGFLVARALGASGPRSFLFAFLVCLAAALSDELHQVLVPGRCAEALDFMADAAGSAAGMGVFAARRLR